jgi:hypothetical protein
MMNTRSNRSDQIDHIDPSDRLTRSLCLLCCAVLCVCCAVCCGPSSQCAVSCKLAVVCAVCSAGLCAVSLVGRYFLGFNSVIFIVPLSFVLKTRYNCFENSNFRYRMYYCHL